MGDRERIGPEALRTHLREQISFLNSSTDAFDRGFLAEAKRIAVVLRVLLNDAGRSRSLLGQLGKLNGDFVTTAIPDTPGNLSGHGGLVATLISPSGVSHIALLGGAFFKDWLPFESWWGQAVFRDQEGNELTRCQLVTIMANQDGGAHVDPSLNSTYRALEERSSLGWVSASSEDPRPRPIVDAGKYAVRQIAHEVLATLDPEYRRPMPKVSGMISAGPSFTVGSHLAPIPTPRVIDPEQPCPCGSGAEYLNCHG